MYSTPRFSENTEIVKSLNVLDISTDYLAQLGVAGKVLVKSTWHNILSIAVSIAFMSGRYSVGDNAWKMADGRTTCRLDNCS